MVSKKLLTLGIIFILAGCSNQIVREPVYTDRGTAYRVTDNKPVTGVVTNKTRQGIEYLTYKKGKLSNKKTVNQEGVLVKESSYDSMGLFHGTVKDGEEYSNYTHGILSGERGKMGHNDSVTTYLDGALYGKQEIDGKVRYFNMGMEYEGDPELPKPLKRNIKWGEAPEKNYSGELYSRPVFDKFVPRYRRNTLLEVKGYEDGILKYVKYYSETGEKIGEYTFYKGDINKILSYTKYSNGMMSLLINYNSEGELDGETIEQYSGNTKLVNNAEGVLHGKVKNRTLYSNKTSKEGIYDLGVFSGELDGEYYFDGMQVDELQNKELIPLNFVDISEIEGASALIKRSQSDYTFIDRYSEGKLIKSYKFFVNNLKKITIPLEGGRYIEETYKEGLLKDRFSYNSKGERDGEFLSIEHRDSKTIGNIINGQLDGKTFHYHGDRVYYVDEYKKGTSYERTTYYDYEKNQVSGRSSGVYNYELRRWIKVGKAYEYYEGGGIRVEKDYGKDPSVEKKVSYTEYYENGGIQKKYTRDYCNCIFLGEYDYYSSSGKLLSKWLYNEKGHRINVKEFDEEGRVTKDITYDEFGREVKKNS